MAKHLTVTLLTVILIAPASASAATDRGAARTGAAWIAKNVGPGADGQAADAIAALRAAGRLSSGDAARRATGLRRGAGSYASAASRTGKAMLGLAAAGVNPRCATGVDLVARLARQRRGARYGSTAYDQLYAMLGLRAAGLRVTRAVVSFALAARKRSGWDFGLRDRGDEVSTTGLMIVALRAAGVSRRNADLRAALRWLRAQRTPAGGFAHARRDRNEANATAIAMMAQRSMGSGDARAARALRGLQRGGGAFQFSATDAGSRVLATNDAVVALSGRTLPVAQRRSARC